MIPGIIRSTQSITLLQHFTEYYFDKCFGEKIQSINFQPKYEGVQNGCIVTINFNSDKVQTKYFVKTHQQSSYCASGGSGVLDPREIFVYVFFSKFNWYECRIGSEEVHFYTNHLNPFDHSYIATKDVEFETFENCAQKLNFTQSFEKNNKYSEGILLADLISKILFLNDTTNNPGNFGFTKDLNLKIVDFQISEDSLKDNNMLTRFLKADFSVANKFELSPYFHIDIEKKNELTKEIFKNLDIIEILDKSKLETLNVLGKNFSQYFKNQDKYKDLITKLNSYIKVVKENFENFSLNFKEILD